MTGQPIKSHHDLIVWQKAMDLVELVYALSARFPHVERYRLVDQITRAVVSVPGNIAEGHARTTSKDYAHFLSVAKGSLMETETYVMLAVRLGYASDADAATALALIAEVNKMLGALRRRLVPRPNP